MQDHNNEERRLGEYLRLAREEAGLTIRELARRVGVDHTYLMRVENGERGDPKPELLQRLAHALRLDLANLLTLVGVASPVPEPRLYFRRYMGLTATEADVLYELAEELKTRRKEGHDEKDD